jgi:hypothetical protein
MYVVRNVFHAKPGKARDLVDKFKRARPHLLELGVHNTRILSDAVAGFWTVVVESEVEDLDTYFSISRGFSQQPEVGEIMKGYMDLVSGGHREILVVE